MAPLKTIVFALSISISALGLCTMTPVMAQSTPVAAPQVPLIEPSQVRGLIAMGSKITIVDVRRQDEFALGHIDGAVLMPLDTLPDTYSSLPKKGKLIIYCRSGHRSAQAVQFLVTHGYTNVVSMNGGYLAWTANNH